MEDTQASPPSSLAQPAPTKKKSNWRPEEDEILVGVLGEQKAAGFQTDNGEFHPDAYNAAAARLGTKGFSRNNSQCSIRFTGLKKDFKEVKELREKSGFGWDAARNVATAGEDVWEKLLQKKPKLGKWKRKSFPLYDELEALLENQIATGSTAFHPGDAHNTLLKAVGDDDDDDGDGEDKDDQTVPQTPAPTRRPLAPTSSSDSISTSIKKRTAATPDPSERPSKRIHGRKPTHSDAGYEVADALRDLARSAAGEAIDPSMQSPVRRRRAIQCIQEDGELSENEMTEAFKLIRRQTSIGDTYLAISNVSLRTRFLQSEIEDARFGSQN
ncbi:hypothetical protein FB446DRAFT_795001 [Lentinula raphanica]|nr:hypothetical protein FB446DRAFT_795001 [Lentinula raphanica]